MSTVTVEQQWAAWAQTEVHPWGLHLTTLHSRQRFETATCQIQGSDSLCSCQLCTLHDSLISAKLTPREEGERRAVMHTYEYGCLHHTLVAFQVLTVRYLRARSSDRPEKSKKLRYSDATSWLNSLLQREKERQHINVALRRYQCVR